MSLPIKGAHRPSHGSTDAHSARFLGTSYRSLYGEQSAAAIAEQSIANDIADLKDEDHDNAIDDDDDDEEEAIGFPLSNEPTLGAHSMINSHRRPSGMTSGPRPFFGAQQGENLIPLDKDRDNAIHEERSLLRDNNLIPPKHPRPRSGSAASYASRKGFQPRVSVPGFMIPRRGVSYVGEELVDEDGQPIEPSETTGLLNGNGHGYSYGQDPNEPYGGLDDPEEIDKKWEDAVTKGQIHTTWQRETKTLSRYSAPLILAFLLQISLTTTSMFTVGHIGKIELGAVSLGGMTANITGYAIYHGLATSLDTLCAQAYGCGKKELVGLQLQRAVFFLWAVTVPIAIVWLAGTQILAAIIPERRIAELAGLYLRILILGAPGYAAFESGKRYVQAQGRFAAILYVLLIAAPLNILMHWLFVWKFDWGFIGCPIAIVITENLMPLLLFLYVRFFGGMECWPGFSRKAFKNWGPMIRLALPGLAMVIAEFLAFEILTLASARISAEHLAAQTILQSVSVLAYQLPFPLSIAISTRVANFIGATLPDAAKVTSRVGFVIGAVLGVINAILLSSLRNQIPYLFSSDEDVIRLAAQTFPVNAAFQIFDSLAAQCNGVLRGLGRQEIGGYVSLFAYYLIAMPVSFGTGFGLNWDLYGLWAGPSVALLVISVVEGAFIYKTSWQRASDEAAKRNAAG